MTDDGAADTSGGSSPGDTGTGATTGDPLLAVEDVANRYEGEEANEHADEILLTASHFERALEAVAPSI